MVEPYWTRTTYCVKKEIVQQNPDACLRINYLNGYTLIWTVIYGQHVNKTDFEPIT